MNRNISRLSAVGLCALVFTLIGGSPRAHAQNPNCCDYIINTTLVPATCFPITILTVWSGGQTDVVTIPSSGYLSRHFPFPCPPAPLLASITMTSAGGCVLTWTTNYCGGCLFIDIV